MSEGGHPQQRFGAGSPPDFQIFKTQEIPNFNYNIEDDTFSTKQIPQAMFDDYTDIKITLIDNGDDRVSLISKSLLLTFQFILAKKKRFK